TLTENTYTPGADHATIAGHRASSNVDLRLALIVNRGGPAQHRVPAAPAAGTVTVGRRSGAPAAVPTGAAARANGAAAATRPAAAPLQRPSRVPPATTVRPPPVAPGPRQEVSTAAAYAVLRTTGPMRTPDMGSARPDTWAPG